MGGASHKGSVKFGERREKRSVKMEYTTDYFPQGGARYTWHDLQPIPHRCETGMRRRRGLGLLYAATGQREQARVELLSARTMCQAMAMAFWLPEIEVALAQVAEH